MSYTHAENTQIRQTSHMLHDMAQRRKEFV